MAYEEKTDWLPDDPINEDDVNRWEKGIKDAHTDLAAHKNDMNNPHNTTKAQIGLGNVDNVQQAAKKDFDQHEQDQVRHITEEEREKWNGGQLSKFTKDDGSVFINIDNGQDFNKVAAEQRKSFTFHTANTGVNTPPQSTKGIYLYYSGNDGEAIAMTNDGGILRKTLTSGEWSEWIFFETEAGSRSKVEQAEKNAKTYTDNHTANSNIHITNDERMKWNGAQLKKLTRDNGRRTWVPDGTDILSLSTGFYYGVGKNIVNNPVEDDNAWYNYDVIDGESGRKTIVAYHSLGVTMWIGMVHTDGEFRGWKRLVTSEELKSENINKIVDESLYQDATYSGNNYPIGITTVSILQGSTGYPYEYGEVLNIKSSKYRFAQFFFYAGNTGEKKIFIRHWYDSKGWTEFITIPSSDELESVLNQAKLYSDSHANNTEIHVTQSDKTKWNNSQIFKLTQDDGSLEKLYNNNLNNLTDTGFYYILSSSTDLNAPINRNGYLLVYNVGTYPYQEFTSYSSDTSSIPESRRKFIRNKKQDSEEWTPWMELENSLGAQAKADKALEDAKNYVDTNYTNEKLIVQQSSVAIQDARTPGTDYPLGITICTINNNNDTGYPLGYGMIKNEKWSHYRFAQYFYGNGDTTNGKNDHIGTWIRHWWNESGWTPWEKISGFAHAIIGRTGKQALNKGEQNKIIFKNIIKDSNNLFDLSNSRFIASHAGMYLVNASLYIENTLQYSNFELYAYVNGSQYKLMNQFRMPSPKDNDDSKEFYATVTGSATVPLNAGDYVEIYVYVGYTGTASRYIFDNPNSKNYFDILELGGQNFPTR
ncbi:pyocin knob domain-containing protein [Bacillus halotolerans]|uniref:pyocin knob domain-containing protein n=1 Tax=Bacillus halotolerans TaxID=260554 RepID=UPI0039908481